MSGHFLILGGAKSGKSRFGEKLAAHLSERPAYIATARGGDEEMLRRISAHRSRRGTIFATIEEPLDLTGAIKSAAMSHDVIVVDCLTLWVSNLMGAGRNVETATPDLVETLRSLKTSRVILVSNEVGSGIVPDNALARAFRDHAGELHQALAPVCASVVFVTAGLPLILKGELPEGV